MPAKTLLAQAIAKMEGFGIKGAIPTIRHNPGDLRHSPHSQHPGGPAHKDDIGTIDNDVDGWLDLERQLVLFANEGLNLRQMVNVYLGVEKDAAASVHDVDGNHRATYLRGVLQILGGVSENMPIKNALTFLAKQ